MKTSKAIDFWLEYHKMHSKKTLFEPTSPRCQASEADSATEISSL